jgi:lipopolysaccharide transport system ATP-binding protein
MSETVIEVEGLGKRYRIGQAKQRDALSHLIGVTLRAPFRVFGGGWNDNSSAQAFGGSSDLAANASSAATSASASASVGATNGGSPYIWALKDISFDVKEGEVVGLIGRNGAGKSTLLKILARITRPTEGHAEIRGRVGSLLEVGTGFHPELTGRENVYMSGSILGMRKAEIDRKFDEIVAFSEVERFLDTPLKHYSSGMQMRLAFAVAAHLDPEILFVDEVLAVGDAGFQKKCLGKMSEVASEGRTIIFVSHNMIAMRALCTRALWISEGRILEEGQPDQVISHYLPREAVTNHEAIWKDESVAPGDHRVRLRSARVIPQVEGDGLITVQTPIDVEFTYWNYVPNVILNVSLALYRSDQSCVFVSVSDYVPRPAGVVRHAVQIPGDLLNAGSYYIDLYIVEDTTKIVLKQDRVAGFEIVEGRAIGNWYGKHAGMVRPNLKWTSEAIAPTGAVLSQSRDQIL